MYSSMPLMCVRSTFKILCCPIPASNVSYSLASTPKRLPWQQRYGQLPASAPVLQRHWSKVLLDDVDVTGTHGDQIHKWYGISCTAGALIVMRLDVTATIVFLILAAGGCSGSHHLIVFSFSGMWGSCVPPTSMTLPLPWELGFGFGFGWCVGANIIVIVELSITGVCFDTC
ncbi:hypothetical protein BJV78DRAFT_1158906 [Lactifluus subvellereus]|nr:hypothetical protein BJV78DRAFT_1158906 [Lactifluus subvellereus]